MRPGRDAVDRLPALGRAADDAAAGYLWADRPRTNVLHLPVVGSGDGGLYSTTADLAEFWRAVFSGRIVPGDVVAEMVRPSSTPQSDPPYGRGFWLGPQDGVVALVGSDAGVSFRSVHDRLQRLTWTVVSNTSEGAWPMARAVAEHLEARGQA